MSSARLNPADIFRDITNSDSTNTTGIRSLYVKTSGNIALKDKNDVTAIFPVAAGQIIPVQPTKVLSTGSTATVIGLY